jgi:hypothetical protein
MGIAALTIMEDYPDICSRILSIAIESVPKGLAETSPDGCYPEGPGYWAYGTEYACYFLSSLDTAMGNDYGLSKVDGFKEAGSYPMSVMGYGGGTFNYGDGGPGLIKGAHLYWMAKKFNAPLYSWYERNMIPDGGPLDLIWYDPEYYSDPITDGSPLDKIFRGPESLVTFRNSWIDKRGIFAGLKAGDNQSSHGDLDIGTFVFDALGKRWAEELGADSYTNPGFWDFGTTAGRWTYYRKRAEGHNTLVINPGPGPDQNVYAVDKFDSFVSGESGAFAVADLSGAYKSGAANVKRGMMIFDGRAKLMLQDEIKLKSLSEVYWFMHTSAAVNISDDGRSVMLENTGERVRMDILSPAEAVFEAGPASALATSPNPPENSPNPGLSRLNIHLLNVKSTTVTVVFTPEFDEFSLTGPLPEVTPLSDWQIRGSTRANLSSMRINGENYGMFTPNVYYYEYFLPRNTAEAVSVAAESEAGEVRVSRPEGVFTKAAVTVTPYDGEMKPTAYYISFLPEPLTDIPDNAAEYKIKSVTASETPQKENPPEHTADGDKATRWSAEAANGRSQWITYDMGKSETVGAVSLLWHNGGSRKSYFDIQLSGDGEQWETVWEGASSGVTQQPEIFDFAARKARYARINGYGNSDNLWVSLCEFRVFGEL